MIDSSLGAWGPGHWQHEPDLVEFEHEGYQCLIVRPRVTGALCGYVAVPPGHPWHGKHCDEVDADVHGGLTYEGACPRHIRRVSKSGELDHWWLGFDCAHAGDVMPNIQYPDPTAEYRNIGYVTDECRWLASQAKEAAASTIENSKNTEKR